MMIWSWDFVSLHYCSSPHCPYRPHRPINLACRVILVYTVLFCTARSTLTADGGGTCTDPLAVLFCTARYYLQLTVEGPVRYLRKEATVTSTLWPFDLCDHCCLPAPTRTEWELRWVVPIMQGLLWSILFCEHRPNSTQKNPIDGAKGRHIILHQGVWWLIP